MSNDFRFTHEEDDIANCKERTVQTALRLNNDEIGRGTLLTLAFLSERSLDDNLESAETTWEGSPKKAHFE